MAEPRGRTRHDAAWKQFFALSVVVEHLLRGFFPEVAALLDFETLTDISGEWVHDGTRRRADAVWRVDYADRSGRSLVVFLEFQSTVSADMARRTLRNVGMAAERLRRNGTLDADGRLRPLCVVIHSGRRRWTAPGAADRIAVSGDGEVLALLAAPYATLDARRWRREDLPARNLVSTLFELNGAATVADAAAPLRALGRWLGAWNDGAEPVRAAYAEWLATTMPALFPPERAAALVERLTRRHIQEEGMTVTVLEERLQREFRRIRREGLERGVQQGLERGLAAERELLGRLAARRFGADAIAQLAVLLADVDDADRLAQVGEWIVDCASIDELMARLSSGRPSDTT